MADLWTHAQDAILMETMADGGSFTDAGKRLNLSRDAAKNRFATLRKRMGDVDGPSIREEFRGQNFERVMELLKRGESVI